jgi:hypothetical protein
VVPRYWTTLTLLFGISALWAQPARVNLYLTETAGIRRTSYPVNARIPFPKGSLAAPSNARLLLKDAEVPAQYSSESNWPDGSVQWLAVDSNASVGPSETLTYRIEYGNSVRPEATPKGLSVSETEDAIQVGSVRFSKKGAPLLLSVKYRGEDISAGRNGIAVVDASGKSHDLTSADPPETTILKRGPLYVVLRYSGKIPIDTGSAASYVLTVEMPNSKSWVKVSAAVNDPGKRLRELSFQTPLAFGPFPWVWDFGTDRWTYGSLKATSESVSLTQTVKVQGGTEWRVSTGPKGQEQLSEAGVPEGSKLVRWGHIQDGKEVVAFGMETIPGQASTRSITIDGNGQASFRFAPTSPAAEHHLTVYQHFVNSPVQIGAVTSPPSMLSPLIAVCDRKQYTMSGLSAPRNAETH